MTNFDKKQKTKSRWQNRFIKQTKVFNSLLHSNRTNWKFLFELKDKITNEFAKTHLTTEELKKITNQYIENEKTKYNLEVQYIEEDGKQYTDYSNSKRFVQYTFNITTEKLQLECILRLYRTGEVYFISYTPCVWSFFVTSIKELKNGFSIFDYIKDKNKELFINTKYEKMCKKIFENQDLFPRHQWGLNTKSNQKEYLEVYINLYLTKELRKNKKEKVKLYHNRFFSFSKDNTPSISLLETHLDNYFSENNLTKNDIILDFLEFRNYMFHNKLRKDDYKKSTIDFPNLYDNFLSKHTEKELEIISSFHNLYKHDIDCLFHKLYLNDEELEQAKEYFCSSHYCI